MNKNEITFSFSVMNAGDVRSGESAVFLKILHNRHWELKRLLKQNRRRVNVHFRDNLLMIKIIIIHIPCILDMALLL